MKRAAIICRVSSFKQDFERQLVDLKRLAGDYLVEEDDVYAEKISGTIKSDSRPAMARLKSNVASGAKKYDMIFAQEVSRIGRNPADSKAIIEFFADYDVPVFVQSLGQCSFKMDGTRNEVFHIIYAVMAEYAKTENDLRVLRSRSGMLEKVRRGHAGGGNMLAYGYKRNKDRFLIIDEEEATIIKRIYQYVVDGLGTKQIAHILNKECVPTRTQKVLKNKGKLKMKGSNIHKDITDVKWVDGTLYEILKNPIYKGERRYKGDTKVEGDFETVPSPVIIQPDLWETVQQTMAGRFNAKVRDTRWLYVLRGLSKCGRCGRNMYGRYRTGGKDSYYQCSSVREKGCGNAGIGIEVLESCIWNLVRENERVYEYFQNTNPETQKAKADLENLTINIKIKEDKINDLTNEVERVNNAYFKGKLDGNKWENHLEKVERSIEETKREMASLKNKRNQLLAFSGRMQKLQGDMTGVHTNGLDRMTIQRILQNILDKVVITSVNQYRNNNKHIVAIFFKDLSDPITMLITSKPKGMKPQDFISDFTYHAVGHGKCHYTSADWHTSQQLTYNDEGLLQTEINTAVDFLENFHPELYDPKDVDNDGENDNWVSVPLLIRMEETNIKERK